MVDHRTLFPRLVRSTISRSRVAVALVLIVAHLCVLELLATTVASLLRPEIEKLLESQRDEIATLRKMVETLVFSRSDTTFAEENRALKSRVFELENQVAAFQSSSVSGPPSFSCPYLLAFFLSRYLI